jgi:YD repeat-containing protein
MKRFVIAAGLWLAGTLIGTTIAVVLASAALAQQRTVYDKSGRVVGQITTDSAGTRTIYGPDGRVVAREATDAQGTTTIYDAVGKKVGTTTMPRKK